METFGINKDLDINTNYSNEIKNIFNVFYSNSKKTIIGVILQKIILMIGNYQLMKIIQKL